MRLLETDDPQRAQSRRSMEDPHMLPLHVRLSGMTLMCFLQTSCLPASNMELLAPCVARRRKAREPLKQ